MEWKALANAVIHDGFDPNLQITIIGCENCGNPFLHLLVSNQFPIFVSDLSRITISIYECPDCGHRELDCIGTYGLPDFLPESVTPFTGHFFELWFEILRFSSKLKIDEKCRFVQVYNPSTERWCKIDRERGKIISNKRSPGPYKRIPVYNSVTGSEYSVREKSTKGRWLRNKLSQNDNQGGDT